MANTLEFTHSAPLTLGVELELQLVNTRDYNLTRGASDLLKLVDKTQHPGEVKPEITESMIELSTDIQADYEGILSDLKSIRDVLVQCADRLNLVVLGGGAHPFQVWSERRIYDTPRFKHLSELYGYLAKQFTVFGQHIHVGCPNGDEALYLTHALSRYIPHFIALSATSPFNQGVDTAFDSSRLTAVNAFPLSGRIPYLLTWADFNAYFDKMCSYGIVHSMKDFYWDIRPKPEFGTIEVRVCDTPLTVERAAQLAAFAQALCHHLLNSRMELPGEDIYLVYSYNRFQACRFGLDGDFIDPLTQKHQPLYEDLVSTLRMLTDDALELGSDHALEALVPEVTERRNGSRWMRERFSETGALADVVRLQGDLWRQGSA